MFWTIISRDLYIGQWKGRLYVIDGYGDDGVIERITSFLLGRGAQLGEGAKNMQEFIDRCVTFCEVDCENNLNNILTGAFLGKTILLLEGFDHCAMIDAKKFPGRGVVCSAFSCSGSSGAGMHSNPWWENHPVSEQKYGFFFVLVRILFTHPNPLPPPRLTIDTLVKNSIMGA